MNAARELLEKVRTELDPLHQKIINHRYVVAVENARMSREALAVFAIQQHHIIASDLRSIALLLALHGNLPSRSYLFNILQGENRAFDELSKFAQAQGISIEAIRGSEPIPAAFAYSTFFAWLAMYGSDAEMVGALSLNFAAWGINCGRMSVALKASYGFSSEAVSFFDLFANMPPSGDAAVEVIQNGLDRGVAAAAIGRAARMLQSYELMYWDAMADTAGV
jgi:pyrroloquinoline quinone (PQQ) biosynthesis protein C